MHSDTGTACAGHADPLSAFDHDAHPSRREELLYSLHCFNRDSTTFSLIIYRHFQGFLVTGQHSGTHWIKWMLSHALAHHYGVAPPRYFNNSSSNDLIGHPVHKRIHPQLPRLASTHSIPPYALQWDWVRRCVKLPPYVLVVRDMRDVLISTYEKWRHKFGVSFGEFLAGDPRAKRYRTDPWNYMHFLNRWGEVARRYPQETFVLRYEDFRQDAFGCLKRLSGHFALPLTDIDLKAGVGAGAKEVMARHQDPAVAERPLRPDGADGISYTPQDMELLKRLMDRHLRHDFGYDFLDQPRGFQPADTSRLLWTAHSRKLATVSGKDKASASLAAVAG